MDILRTDSVELDQIDRLEHDRLEHDPRACFFYERKARSQGYFHIAGVDEAGRGPLAGPVVAAAVILPHDLYVPGVDDSKKLTEARRDSLYHILTTNSSIQWAIGIVNVQTIDSINILEATKLAMQQAVEGLPSWPDYLIIDGLELKGYAVPNEKIIKGDQLSHTIAAASIIAKVTRDRIMMEYAKDYPQYGFDKHKGYGTELHMETIHRFGPSPIHRLSFSPISKGKKNDAL